MLLIIYIILFYEQNLNIKHLFHNIILSIFMLFPDGEIKIVEIGFRIYQIATIVGTYEQILLVDEIN